MLLVLHEILTEQRWGAHEITAIVNKMPLLNRRMRLAGRVICAPRSKKYENRQANSVIGKLNKLILLVTSRVHRH